MARENKRNTKLYVTLYFLLIIVASVGIVLYFYFDNKTKKEQEKQNRENEEYLAIEEVLKTKEEELNKINEEIAGFDTIDEKIASSKEAYYKSIKELEDKIVSGESDKKIAYLTFDDGPYYNTYKVLDILDKYNVNATFFLTSINGEYCFDNKSANCYELYKEYLKRGHTIANHTYTHGLSKGLYNSVSNFIDAVNKQHEHIKEQTGGYIANIMRFPGGIPTAKARLGANGYQQATEELRKIGYGWVDWTTENGDGKDIQSTSQAWSNIKYTLGKNIEVILLHDYNKVTTSMLPELIEYLQDKGYILLPLFYESTMINK